MMNAYKHAISVCSSWGDDRGHGVPSKMAKKCHSVNTYSAICDFFPTNQKPVVQAEGASRACLD